MPIFSTYRFSHDTIRHHARSAQKNRQHFRRNKTDIAKYQARTCYFSPGFATILTTIRSRCHIQSNLRVKLQPAGKNIFPQWVAICPRNVPIYSEGQFGQQLSRICRRGPANDTGDTRPSWISPCGARCPVRLRGYLMISMNIYNIYLLIYHSIHWFKK